MSIVSKFNKLLEFETIKRFIYSFFYNKNWFKGTKGPEVFNEFFEKNLWGSEESKSGGGSTIAATKAIRHALPTIIQTFNIKTMLDIPCGDFNWMKTIQLNCSYIGGDIVKPMIQNNQELYSNDHIQFQHLDLTQSNLPCVDLVFCRDCLQHLSFHDVYSALKNIKASGSKYLLVTSYPNTLRNYDIITGDYRALNLFKSPFCLSKPLLKIEEKSNEPSTEKDKTMFLFDLSELQF